MVNPFIFESPTDRWSFTDREQLLPELLRLMRERGRRLLMHSRRRMGKTSLVGYAGAKSKGVLVYVDISTAASLADVAKKLLDAAPPEDESLLQRLLGLAKKHLQNFAIVAGKISLTADFRQGHAEHTIQQVLDYLDDRAELEDQPWTICFDEFQDMRTLVGPRADWVLRGTIQHHRHLNYIFTGSDHRLVLWMTQAEAAFFKQLQQMEVGPIDPKHMATWVDTRAQEAGLRRADFGARCVELAGPCTGDIVRLAKTSFDVLAGGPPKSADPVEGAMLQIITSLDGEFVARWSDLSVSQRNVLLAVAAGKQPLAGETLREYGFKSTSTAQSALERLVDRQILVRLPEGIQFDSPFLRRWVLYHAA